MSKLKFDWRDFIPRIVLMTLGAVISAVSVVVFMTPFEIAPGGVTGAAVILNHLIGTPVGLMIILGNIPIQYIGYRMLGGWGLLASTIYVVALNALAIDFLTPVLPPSGVSNDILLNALFGGVIGGIGGGMVYSAGATFGGTSTLTRIMLQKFGIPLATGSLYTDTFIIVAAGLVFGWEKALYAMVALFVGAMVSDYVLEGPSVIRTVTIITDHPREVSAAVLDELQRGVTAWEGRGMFTEKSHSVLFITVTRSQVNPLRRLVQTVDPDAFIVIGQGHIAYGQGFKKIRKPGQPTLEIEGEI
jgi:uncharacterized membrane-anchored protein YitT (DUF2179 family)